MSSSDTAGGGGGSGTTGASTSSSATGAIRAIGQATQVRVVMPTNLITAAPSMIKQIESAGGRTQLTAMPASAGIAARSVSNASITVARPITQGAYLPRASVTATQMAGVATTATGQRLVTPIRAASASAVAGATVTGLTAGGSFVRATAGTAAAVNRNTAAPATTVISPATSTTWMAANTAGQVQLIRAISHQPRQRIITTQSLGTGSTSGAGNVVPPSVGNSVLSGTVVAAASTIGGNSNQTTSGSGGLQPQTTLQSAVSSVAALTSQPQQQPTYVATLATVLPPRQHQATLVYSSNVGNATVASAVAPQATQSIAQTQQFSPTLSTTQRFAVATSLTAAAAAASNAPRQLRQIPLAKPISTTKLSTASISIRAPNLPQLTPTIATATGGLATVAGSVAGTITSGNATVTARSGAVTGIAGSTATANVIPGGSLSTTRIIQLQQQPGGTAQQIIGSTGRLAGNVMLQPFIVNTTGGNKIGLRPPVTMAAKGQPSLTITHMGISKLPTTVSSATIAAAAAASQPSNLQALSGGVGGVVSTVATNLSASVTPTVAGSIISATSTVSAAATSAAGLLAAQNIVSSGAAGGATVVPLAIATRGGTLTSIKNANGITVGKVVTPALNDGTNTPSGANVFIQQQQQQQRPGSAGLSGVSATSVVASSSSTTSSTAVTSTGSSSTVVTSSAAAFLPPGSTIYYESIPASTVHASTGVLSITTATLTASTMSQQQTAIAAVASGSLPSTSSTSFTVVPSNSNGAGVGVGARAISQLQPIVSSTAAMGSHVQAVRFSTPIMTAASEATTNAQQQVLMATQQVGGNIGGQHMVIPLQTSIKVTTAGGAASSNSTVVPNFLRKRENLGSSENPIRAAKNLAPTLLSMGAISTATSAAAAASSPSSSVSSTSSTHNIPTSASAAAAVAASTATATVTQSLSPAPSTCSSFSTVSSSNVASSTLTVEALSKKDRAHAQSRSRAASPASSDGSTTVSANSSPGVEQQQMAQDEGGLHHSTHFNPIHELYPNHHQQQQQQQQTQQVGQGAINVAVNAPNTRMNGGINSDGPPRKRARRGTNDSQQSNQSQPSSSFSMPAPIAVGVDCNADRASVQTDDNLCNNNQTSTNQQQKIAGAANAQPQPTGNKENAKPVEYFLRRPRNCTLLSTYKSNWKSANNHFQRYTDVKQREERRPTVIDVANQANIQGKLSGWKIYHLRALMEDVAENEEASHSHLTEILKSVEQLEKTSDTERLGDLLKGNIQRNKIIVDGMNDAKNQIMKILDHQSHVSEILSRCASKRNFKKRDKV